jgi:hypothetical protein
MSFFKVTFAVESHSIGKALEVLGALGKDVSTGFVVERQEEGTPPAPDHDAPPARLPKARTAKASGRGKPKRREPHIRMGRPPERQSAAVLLERLRRGPATQRDLVEALVANGFKPGSLASALSRLKREGKVVPAGAQQTPQGRGTTLWTVAPEDA